MTDVVTKGDVYEAFQQELEEVRGRIAAFMLALDEVKGDPLNDDVVAKFDSDGYLDDLWVDPTAMRRYTNVELEGLITDVLQGTERGMKEAVRGLLEEHGLSDLLEAPVVKG
jgi:hypothetical protein